MLVSKNAKMYISCFLCQFQTSVVSFLGGRTEKRYNRPVELLFLSLNFITLVSSVNCSILKLSCDIIRRYVVLYFLPKKSLLLQTYYEIRGLVSSHNGANMHSSVPTILYHLLTNIYTTVVDLIYVYRLMEPAL